MALSVPLSRFTPRVGGGSAFFVRQHERFDMTRAFQYFAGFVWIMPAVWLLSFVLLVEESGWDDSSEPLWLRVSAIIVFPPRCLFALFDHLHLSDHILTMVVLPAMFLNSFLWAFGFVFLCRFVTRFVRAKRKGLQNAA